MTLTPSMTKLKMIHVTHVDDKNAATRYKFSSRKIVPISFAESVKFSIPCRETKYSTVK